MSYAIKFKNRAKVRTKFQSGNTGFTDGLPPNSFSIIFLVPFGILILFKDTHAKKALFPMLVTLLGMVIEVRESHQEKALSPMLVTLSGMVIEVRDLQSSKALAPMLVTP